MATARMAAFPEVKRLYSDCIATVFSEGNGYGSYDRFHQDSTVIFRLNGYVLHDRFPKMTRL
jgi:hypothetical protein